MQQRLRAATIVAALAVLVLTLFGPVSSGSAESTNGSEKLDGALASALAGAAAGDDIKVIATTSGAPAAAAGAVRNAGGTVAWEYTLIDGFAATVPAARVGELAARDDVTSVWLDRPTTTLMDVSHKAIQADRAWAAGYEGQGVTVAVLDTGADRTHPDLSPAIVSCVSLIGGVTTPECADSDGHGTHVAGTVASRDTKYPGVARKANLAVVRVLHAAGTGFNSDIIAGMEWVAANKNRVSPPIKIATMSIGYLEPECGDDSNPDAQAANALVDAGLVFTVAAGNSGHDECTIDGASAASKAISVAAVDDRGTVSQADDRIADFSSGGSPENNKPDISFPGVGITSTFPGAGLLLSTASGTSMATPHAAGTAALLLQKEPSLSPAAVKDRLAATAVKNANTGTSFNLVYGHGLGNACRALQLTSC